MSSRRNDSPESPLCWYIFKDGRHCSQPARPDFDGLCYSHGTFVRRASRQDNLHHVLDPLANGRTSVKARNRALRALTRAITEGRVSPERAQLLTRISVLIDQSARFADSQSFTSTDSPAWTRLRQAVDALDSFRNKPKP